MFFKIGPALDSLFGMKRTVTFKYSWDLRSFASSSGSTELPVQMVTGLPVAVPTCTTVSEVTPFGATGNVEKSRSLAPEYFGEGVAVLGNKIYQLTWKNGDAFVYDLDSRSAREVVPGS